MAVGSVSAFFVYWFLWVRWDEEKFKNHKLYLLLFVAAGLGTTRLIYMGYLCG